MYHLCFVYTYPFNGYRELNLFKESCLTQVATITSFGRELNLTGVGEHHQREMIIENIAQILDKAVYVSLCIYALGNDKNPSLQPPARGKIVRQIRLFSFGETTGLGEGKTLNSKSKDCWMENILHIGYNSSVISSSKKRGWSYTTIHK